MKHSICGFNHLELLLNKIDCVDVQIIRCIVDFRDTGRMRILNVGGKEYFWVSYDWLKDELPICEIGSNKTLGRRLSSLVENGVMERYIESGSKTYYRFNEDKMFRMQSFPQFERGTNLTPAALKSTAPVPSNEQGAALKCPAIYPNTNIPNTKEPKEETPEELHTPEKEINPLYRECSDLLKKRVLETRQMKITEDTLLKWDNTVRLMMQRDHNEEHPRTLEGLTVLINECHDMPPDPRTGFTWARNILSMETLRLRWNEGKIYIGMTRGRRMGTGSRIIDDSNDTRSRIIDDQGGQPWDL